MSMIRVRGVSKKYRAYKPAITLKESFSRSLSGKPPANWAWALRNVSFSVNAGEAVGIVGHNGAGKSTMLRLLARVSRPTGGIIESKGRMVALLELGAGFHPDLTGRENIYLNGTLLGLRRAEIRKRFDEIVAFSEVEDFIDMPVKHYSQGMTLRLSFAIAAHVHCDVLLLDEVLSVGDIRFSEKCLTHMRRQRDLGTTIVLSSHSLETVADFCSRLLMFRGGELAAEGPPDEVIALYKRQLSHSAPTDAKGNMQHNFA